MRKLGLETDSAFVRFIERRAFWLTMICGTILFGVGLTIAHRNRSYNSDDTAQQTILGIWDQGLRLKASVPLDNYIGKLPFYSLLNAIIPDPRTALLVATLSFNLVGFVLFGLSVRYFWMHFARPNSASPWLALVWLPMLGYGLYDIIINPNTRNLEIGLAFASLALFAQYLKNGLSYSPRKSTMIVGIALLLNGLFIYHNAYYFVFMLVPLGAILFLSLLAYDYEPRSLRLLIFLGLSLVVSVGWRLLLHLFGWVIVGESAKFATPDQLGFHFEVLLEGSLIIFGANLLGRDILSTDIVRPLAQLALVVPLFAYPWYVIRNYRLPDHLWRFYFSLLPYFVALVFISTNYVIDMESKRYLVLLPFAATVSVGFLYADLRKAHLKILLTLVLAVNVVFGLISVLTPNTSGQTPNFENTQTIKQVQSHGLDKGYTNFWLGNINTYLSNGEADFIQVVCVDGRLRPYRFLTDEGVLDKPAERSFYLFDNRRSDMAGCDIWSLEPQLGAPLEIVQINDHLFLAIYSYDIVTMFDD